MLNIGFKRDAIPEPDLTAWKHAVSNVLSYIGFVQSKFSDANLIKLMEGFVLQSQHSMPEGVRDKDTPVADILNSFLEWSQEVGGKQYSIARRMLSAFKSI
jgi:hypothetical protein